MVVSIKITVLARLILQTPSLFQNLMDAVAQECNTSVRFMKRACTVRKLEGQLLCQVIH